jgi:hypothetical protein
MDWLLLLLPLLLLLGLAVQQNTSVYVAGLPDNTDVDEVAGVFSKCGIIKLDEQGQPKIKLYRWVDKDRDRNVDVDGDSTAFFIFNFYIYKNIYLIYIFFFHVLYILYFLAGTGCGFVAVLQWPLVVLCCWWCWWWC